MAEPAVVSATTQPAITQPSRRGFLGSATAAAAGIALAGTVGRSVPARAATITDTDILNFALNLEYLEAEFYLQGVFGQGLSSTVTKGGVGTYGDVVSRPPTNRVTFVTPTTQAYMTEIANDERNHVLFLREQLGSAAITEPMIDIGTAFNTLSNVAGLGPTFDPYASETNFILGGFIFEDVGVTAYLGAAPLISNKTYLSAAGAILAVEAYHSGILRTLLNTMAFGTDPNSGIYLTAQQISNTRDSLDGPLDDDQGLLMGGAPNNVPTTASALAFSRTTTQVLNIVYGDTTTTPGLFFPAGTNGVIK